ncbi:hypothetical protein JTB14_009322 [Gonioctena quinquepunctata]|nr:hypothetical protein JTB14_009322 [Gonioctena quinquepunctata]
MQKEVKVVFYCLKVRPFIPSPLRCFRCQLSGHTTIRYTQDQVCVCGEPLHIGTPCSQPIKYVICESAHTARSKDCPTYKQEIAIQEMEVRDNIPYSEARWKDIVHTSKWNAQSFHITFIFHFS